MRVRVCAVIIKISNFSPPKGYKRAKIQILSPKKAKFQGKSLDKGEVPKVTKFPLISSILDPKISDFQKSGCTPPPGFMSKSIVLNLLSFHLGNNSLKIDLGITFWYPNFEDKKSDLFFEFIGKLCDNKSMP